jgi:hypothetical protein
MGKARTGNTPINRSPSALVRINFDKFAIKLHRKLNSPKRTELLAKWQKLGGKPELLISTVNKAVAKYMRKHPGKYKPTLFTGKTNVLYTGQTVGAEPLSVTIIAAATPIITALLKFLKPEKADEITEASSAVQDAVQNYRESDQSSSNQSQEQQSEQQTVGAVDPYLLYGGLALAGYLIYKNKRKLFA